LKIIIRLKTIEYVALVLYIIFYLFHQIIMAILGYKVAVMILLAAFCLGLISQINNLRYASLGQCLWVVYALVVSNNNQSISHGNISEYLITLTHIGFAYILSKEIKDIGSDLVQIIACLGLIHCLATIVLFIIPNLYSYVINIYGAMVDVWGPGVGSEFGYRAGITSHYSSNGIYCAFTCIAFAAEFFANKDNKNKLMASGFILSAFALVLTAKRGHIIFMFFSLIITYVLVINENYAKKVFKVFFVFIVTLIGFIIAAKIIPVVSLVLERFLYNGDFSSGRFVIWKEALTTVKDNLLFGIGWKGFYYKTLGQNSYLGYTNVHNIYIQLLCEAGIIGLIAVSIIFAYNLLVSIKVNKKLTDYADKKVLFFAVSSQIFFIIYGFTGCGLYDFTFIMYVLSSALILSYWYNIRRN